MKNISPGDYVVWKWAGSIAHGLVLEVIESRLEIESEGKCIVRNGSPKNPAILIKHKSGNLVIKLASELTKVSEEN